MRRALLAALPLALLACGPLPEPDGQQGGPLQVEADAGPPGVDAGALPGEAGVPDAGVRECEPGTVRQCSSPCMCMSEDGNGGCLPGWYVCGQSTCQADGTWGGCALNTPLVLAFDGEPVRYAPAPGHFELGQGALATTDWPAAATPWLVLDRDGSGAIEDGRELFGSLTVLTSGARARHGFEALAELDSNHDGRLDARDAAWPQLRLWSDRDADRASSPSELEPLPARGVSAIELGFSDQARCDARGNCEVERAAFLWRDARGCERRGAVIDLHLPGRPEAVAAR